MGLAVLALSGCAESWPGAAPASRDGAGQTGATQATPAVATSASGSAAPVALGPLPLARAAYQPFVEAHAARDCQAVLATLDALEAAGGLATLGPYPALQRAACDSRLGDRTAELAAARAALAANGGGPRLARIEAYERVAEASHALGDDSAALDAYSQALDLAGTRAYRAEMLLTTGRLAHQVGRDDLAVQRLRTLVVDFGDQPGAAAGLDALAAMGAEDAVSPYQAGVALSHAGAYVAAVAQLDNVPEDSPDAGAAHLAHAGALAKLDRGDDALAELAATAQAFPSQAGAALLRAGQLLERNGRYADADAAYSQVAQVATTSAAAPEAALRAGIVRYAQDDWSGALAAWRTALDLDRAGRLTPAMRVETLFWRGKALARTGGAASADARDAWLQAAAAAPESYYGLRATDMLRGELTPLYRSGSGLAAPTLDLPIDQRVERAQWLAALSPTLDKLTPERVAAEVAAGPGLGRAAALLDLGLRDEAGWEVDGLARRYAEARDLPRLGALGDWAMSHGLPAQTLLVGRQMDQAAAGASLPRALVRSLYPAGFGQLASDAAHQHGADPLLLLALVRQESGFDPNAHSRAGALGLTQVLPSTARGIAQETGRAEALNSGDLYDPAVSLDYGAWYLAAMAQRYGGRLLPTVAAYNAGGGNVDRWLQRSGADPDLFYETVPFEETASYIERVYVGYRLYQRLYGG